ncbi:hypothetical protein ATY77_26710 [Rhizobium sp. R634]|uniref:hypothetical protein n=1 Tax=Rhizobium sp. R634 TaxID=1764274 RepID=UPI000B5360E5|nr:hypothetical protein [Rhizobium sp. R634]OWV79582.1 hypothetical protein ATY77_26710 [Rhizobium sp. R634]
MFDISLDWFRPVDGVEVTESHGLFQDAPDRRMIIARSERLHPIAYRVENLEDPKSIRLLNARNVDDLANFVARFGVPDRLGYNPEGDRVLVSLIEALRDEIADGFHTTQIDDDIAKRAWAENALRHVSMYPAFEYSDAAKRMKLGVRASSLADLMLCEVAFALEVGAKLHNCEKCSKAFISGHLTGRRANAVYCSDKCRVAAMRQRNSKGA